MRSTIEDIVHTFQEKYADIAFYILQLEDPKFPGVHHYLKLHALVKSHYQNLHIQATDADIAAEIRSAALELATIFIVEARTFTTLFPAEVFSHMETTLKRRWRASVKPA